MELLVVGLRPAREKNLLLEFLMPDERADDTGGNAKPRTRYIVTGQQDVRYTHYALVDRGASHLVPGPQDALRIPAERLASRLSGLRYAKKQDLSKAGPAALHLDSLDKFLGYFAPGGAHAAGEQRERSSRRTCRHSRCARRRGRTCPSPAAPRCRPCQKAG